MGELIFDPLFMIEKIADASVGEKTGIPGVRVYDEGEEPPFEIDLFVPERSKVALDAVDDEILLFSQKIANVTSEMLEFFQEKFFDLKRLKRELVLVERNLARAHAQKQKLFFFQEREEMDSSKVALSLAKVQAILEELVIKRAQLESQVESIQSVPEIQDMLEREAAIVEARERLDQLIQPCGEELCLLVQQEVHLEDELVVYRKALDAAFAPVEALFEESISVCNRARDFGIDSRFISDALRHILNGKKSFSAMREALLDLRRTFSFPETLSLGLKEKGLIDPILAEANRGIFEAYDLALDDLHRLEGVFEQMRTRIEALALRVRQVFVQAWAEQDRVEQSWPQAAPKIFFSRYCESRWEDFYLNSRRYCLNSRIPGEVYSSVRRERLAYERPNESQAASPESSLGTVDDLPLTKFRVEMMEIL